MEFWLIIFWLLALLLAYFAISIIIVLILAKYPRSSVEDPPDWGSTKEYRIPTVNGKMLECWVVYPKIMKNYETINEKLKKSPCIILLHGWGRNWGRMVSRARIYGQKGYITILLSARDHGRSDKERLGMNILRFSQDLEATLNWWGKPAILTGHSIGGGAALLVAARNSLVRAVIAEAAPYAIPQTLKHIYWPALKWLTHFFLPGINAYNKIRYRKFTIADFSPLDAASKIRAPTLLIHGKNDDILPYEDSVQLGRKLDCQVWIPENTTHYNIEEHPDYASRIYSFLESITEQ
ncbi:MAG: alpha/beta hydrolase family protein [Candidatus Heimdallarchaeota archaeon]